MEIPGGIEAGDSGGDDPASWDWTYNVMAAETRSPGDWELLSPIRKHPGSNLERVIVPDELDATQADVMAAQQAVAILESRGSASEPFFLPVGMVRSHVLLVAPKRWFDQYPADGMELPPVPDGDLSRATQ